VDRAEVMSLATLFDGTPAMVNDIPNELESVSPADVKEFVAKYLAKTNRTIINRVPATKAATSSGNEKKNQ
jgi:predicted Zn-dependent peptidase